MIAEARFRVCALNLCIILRFLFTYSARHHFEPFKAGASASCRVDSSPMCNTWWKAERWKNRAEALVPGFWNEGEKRGLGKGHMKMLTLRLCSQRPLSLPTCGLDRGDLGFWSGLGSCQGVMIRLWISEEGDRLQWDLTSEVCWFFSLPTMRTVDRKEPRGIPLHQPLQARALGIISAAFPGGNHPDALTELCAQETGEYGLQRCSLYTQEGK